VADITAGWHIERLSEDEEAYVVGLEAMPRSYICPISRKPMTEPVRSPTTGHWYEKRARENLLARNEVSVCPVTGKRFNKRDDSGLAFDIPMAQRIRAFIDQDGE
jgi:hypothetical protein